METQVTHKGLYTDSHPLSQPKDTYRFALNAVNDSREGDIGFLTNEKGTTPCPTLPEGYSIIGDILMADDIRVAFITNNTLSQIGLIQDCIYTPILTETANNSFLNFSTQHQIQGTYRVVFGCQRTVYFTDFYNPIRTIDIDKLINSPEEYQDSTGDWDAATFRLFPNLTVPIISNIVTNDSGGNLTVGTYQAVIQYLDSDLNPTNWFDISNPVPIFDEKNEYSL